MSLELKPCPFCGGGAEIVQIGNEATKSRGFEVRCMTWGCTIKKRAMVIRQPIEKAREYAVAAWNQRSDAARQEGARGGEPVAWPMSIDRGVVIEVAAEALWRSGGPEGHWSAAGDGAQAVHRAWAADVIEAISALFSPAEPSGWRPMESAPKDGTYILARVAPQDDDDRWGYLSGRCFVIRHEGRTPSGYDLGWSVFPGFGGVSDDWFEGWLPLPPTSEGGGA